MGPTAQNFESTYKTIHRFETNRLRNIAKYFAHSLATDALDWSVFALVSITEQDTTSSSRIFLKILFNELVEALGMKTSRAILGFLHDHYSTNAERDAKTGVPLHASQDHPKNTRFAINYFTSIGLGALTEGMKLTLRLPFNWLKLKAADESSSSESESSSGSSSES
jgi:pre-mRNA-splicing factor CWC22